MFEFCNDAKCIQRHELPAGFTPSKPASWVTAAVNLLCWSNSNWICESCIVALCFMSLHLDISVLTIVGSVSKVRKKKKKKKPQKVWW